MLAHEVVVESPNRKCIPVVADSLGERVRESRVPAHPHSHAEVRAFHVRSCHGGEIGKSGHCFLLPFDHATWGVTLVWGAIGRCIFLIELYLRCVIHFASERRDHVHAILRIAVARDLNALLEFGREFAEKRCRRPQIARPDGVRRNQLAIGTDRRPRPHTAVAVFAVQFIRQVPVFGMDEGPAFVQLDPLACKASNPSIHECFTRRAYRADQREDRTLCRSRDSGRSANAHAFDKAIQNPRFLLDCQRPHACYNLCLRGQKVKHFARFLCMVQHSAHGG